MKYMDGLVVYGAITEIQDNHNATLRVEIYHIGEIPQGIGSLKLWDHIYDIKDSGAFKCTPSPEQFLSFEIVDIKELSRIRDGDYPIIEWVTERCLT